MRANRRAGLGLAVAVAAGMMAACAGPGEEPPPPAPAATAPGAPTSSGAPATVQRLNPVLTVEAIEPVVPFWEGLGFVLVNPIRDDGTLVYASFSKDGLSVNYQTPAQFEQRLAGGNPSLGDTTSIVYVTVDDLDAIIERLGSAEVVIPRQQTAWGSDEIYVREPGGHLIGFAAFGGN